MKAKRTYPEQEIKIEVRPSVPPPLPNPGFLFVTLIWLTAEDTCGGTVRGGSGVVTSPGYPGNYGNQADCTWILLAEPGDTISVIFTDFQTEEKYDYLEVEGSEPPTIWWVGLFNFFLCVCLVFVYVCVPQLLCCREISLCGYGILFCLSVSDLVFLCFGAIYALEWEDESQFRVKLPKWTGCISGWETRTISWIVIMKNRINAMLNNSSF